MRFLILDTSLDICSVALCNEQGEVLACKTEREPKQHISALPVFVSDILKEHQLDSKDLTAIGVVSGPGSYTGLRIGSTFAQGLAFVHQQPIVPISTLYMLAYGHQQQDSAATTLISAIDARRNEVYMGIYTANLETLYPETAMVLTQENIAEWIHLLKGDIVAIGNGAAKIIQQIQAYYPATAISESDIEVGACQLGNYVVEAYQNKKYVEAKDFLPNYLKEFYTTAKISES